MALGFHLSSMDYVEISAWTFDLVTNPRGVSFEIQFAVFEIAHKSHTFNSIRPTFGPCTTMCVAKYFLEKS
jgi:hypothetical protein